MALEPSLVATSFRDFLGQWLAPHEAGERARLLATREELLAVLLARESAFGNNKGLTQSLTEVASRTYSSPSTPRKDRGSPTLDQEGAINLANAIEQLINSEAERQKLTSAVHEAMQRRVRYWPSTEQHPGYHWLVRREGQ